jgi:hypothetical protein
MVTKFDAQTQDQTFAQAVIDDGRAGNVMAPDCP